MRQHHVAGDKLFVDYSGKKIGIIDPATGEVRDAEIFVAVLGASNYTYAEATWTQTLPDWIGAHVRMLRFLGGCPRLIVPDNLKSAVHKPSFFDPDINRSYGMMASHYAVGILPARPRRPRDKASVSYCTSFRLSCTDTSQPRWTPTVAPATTLNDFQARWNVPKPAPKAVRVTLLDQSLDSPFLHRCRADPQLLSDFPCGKHTTSAHPVTPTR